MHKQFNYIIAYRATCAHFKAKHASLHILVSSSLDHQLQQCACVCRSDYIQDLPLPVYLLKDLHTECTLWIVT